MKINKESSNTFIHKLVMQNSENLILNEYKDLIEDQDDFDIKQKMKRKVNNDIL